MKLLTAGAWSAITMIVLMMYLDEQILRLTVGSCAAVLVFVFWIGQESILEEALSSQRLEINKAISQASTDAYERGRKFGAIHAEDVQEEITLARQRELGVFAEGQQQI